jgi:hypothetical protein
VALPNANVRRESEVMKWMEMIPLLKDTMDLWFGQHPKDERFLQQVVAWENNSSGWAVGTDYFVIDIEYANRQGARFDIVALRWHSTAAARKLSRGYQPRLTIIEVKAGDGAVKGKSGLREHLKHSAKFLADRVKIENFRSEMLRVFEQKRELQLIRSLLKNKHKIEQVDNDIDEALLIIGHDPDSTKLDKELKEVKKSRGVVLVCHANHAGFGLYADNMTPL